MSILGLDLASKHFDAFTNLVSIKQSTKTNARDKLAKLSTNQFMELSTDVYDELIRRCGAKDEFLLPNLNYHPKVGLYLTSQRNQARQKLATLSRSRFDELVSDVYFEILTRFPSLSPRRPSLSKLLIPSVKPSEPDPTPTLKIVPKPGMNGGPVISIAKVETQASDVNFASLDNLMADLGGMMNSSSYKRISPEPKSGTRIQRSLERPDRNSPPRQTSANGNGTQALLDQSHQQLESMGIRLKEKDTEIASLLGAAQKKNLESEKEYRDLTFQTEQLEKEISGLQQDLKDQHKITGEIRQEAANLLAEIKALSVENVGLRGAKDKSAAQINELFNQIQDYQDKLERESRSNSGLLKENVELKQRLEKGASKIGSATIVTPQIRSGGVQVTVSRTNPNIDFDNDDLANVAFKRERVEEYYMAVNQLLSETRAQEEPNTAVLVAMKSIVLACKAITEDCEVFEKLSRIEEADRADLKRIKQQVLDLLTKLSQALTNQMLIAKKAAIDPTDAVKKGAEEALLCLTTVVLQLFSKSAIFKSKEAKPQPKQDPNALKIHLEQETEQIVQSIQILLQLLRQPSWSPQEFQQTIDKIASIVENLVEASDRPMRQMGIPCDSVLGELRKGRDGLIDLGERIGRDPASKGLKQQVASCSYEIAKFVKQLIGLI